MPHLLILVAAFLTAAFTLLSGFGLGTILTPVFALFYDIKIAVFLVAIVHLLNNLFKLAIFRKHIRFDILKRFGILAIVGSLIGAFAQAYLGNAVLKKGLGIVLIFLAAKELMPPKFQFRFPKSIDPIGGFCSGLLGGLVGNQGAIRAAFLLNYEISKETFIATGVVIACLIDVVRIPVYLASYSGIFAKSWQLLVSVAVVTFLGTLFGNQLLKRFSFSSFRKLVAYVVILMGIYFLL
jgi:hypothetical protein